MKNTTRVVHVRSDDGSACQLCTTDQADGQAIGGAFDTLLNHYLQGHHCTLISIGPETVRGPDGPCHRTAAILSVPETKEALAHRMASLFETAGATLKKTAAQGAARAKKVVGKAADRTKIVGARARGRTAAPASARPRKPVAVRMAEVEEMADRARR